MNKCRRTYLSAVAQNVSTAFDNLAIDCGNATGNRFHCLKDRVQDWFLQLPAVKRNIFFLIKGNRLVNWPCSSTFKIEWFLALTRTTRGFSMATDFEDEPEELDDAPAADDADALPMCDVIVCKNQLKLPPRITHSPCPSSALTFLIAPTKSKLPARFGRTRISLVMYL